MIFHHQRTGTRRSVRILSACLVLAACLTGHSDPGQAAPAAAEPLSHPNAEAIRQIKVANPDQFAFVFLGDNRGSTDVFENILRDAGKVPGAAFVMDDGDLVPSGKEAEFKLFLNQVRDNLTLPLLTAIGNHEIKNGGDKLFRQIFGPTHYTYRIGKTAFIVSDNANEKLTDDEAQWLTDELKAAQDCTQRFVILHVPPYDPRPKNSHCLTAADAKRLMEIMKAGRVTEIFAGHIHGYYTGQWEGIPFVISGGAGAPLITNDPDHAINHYLVVHVNGGKVEMELRQFSEPVAKAAEEKKTKAKTAS